MYIAPLHLDRTGQSTQNQLSSCQMLYMLCHLLSIISWYDFIPPKFVHHFLILLLNIIVVSISIGPRLDFALADLFGRIASHYRVRFDVLRNKREHFVC